MRLWFVALALLVVGCGEPEPTRAMSFAASTITFPDTVIDRGVPGGVQSITVTNTGTALLTPTFALTDEANFAIKSTTCHALAPGESCDVVVGFEPHALGAHSIELIATAAETSSAVTLVGLALPEPGLTLAPTSALDFDDVAMGTSKTLRVTVVNKSPVKARAYTVALAGTNAGDFALVDDTCTGTASDSNESCTVDVRFAPSATSPRDASLVVSSGNLGTVTLPLSGNGYLPAQLTVSPATGMFGSLFSLGDSDVHAFTVTNSGTVPSPIVSVAISGPNASYFAMTDGCSGSTLPGGEACMFSIVYHPGSVGQHEAVATVSAGSLASVAVPLTGAGEPAKMLMSPDAWNFGSVLVAQTATQIFTVENTGSTNTGPLAVGFAIPTSTFAIGAGCTNVDIAPGASCSFAVTATPTARGFRSASLRVGGTRGDKVVSVLQVQGVIAATLVATPGAIAFGDVQMTETPSKLVIIENRGDLETGALAVAIAGDDGGDVSAVGSCSGRSLQPFESCSLTVSFAPSSIGAESATIEITSAGATLTIPVTANRLPAPLFTVSPDAVTLNPVVVGESYPQTLVVQGTGAITGPLSVAVSGPNAAEYVVTDDACSGQTVAIGQSCAITVTLTPAATASRKAVLTVAGSPGGHRNVALTGIAFTQARLTISRSTVMFTSTGIGQTDTFGFLTIKNTGEVATGTLSAQLTGANPTEFGVIADTCSGAVLAPNAECSVHTQFAPTQIATSMASLVVAATPGGTVSAALSGTGLAPPVISTMITSYDFAPQETFTERFATVRIYNIGGSKTDQLHATLSGPQAALFTADDYFCFSVAAGAYCDVRVTFHPTEVGQASATLVVDSPLAGSVTVALTATATPGAKVVVSPSVYDFGFVAAGGTSVAKSFVATNIGQRDVTMFHAFVPSQCDNFKVVSTTCGSTLGPNATCQADVVFGPITSSNAFCRLVFVEDTLVMGEAELLGQSSF
jgi:hypothetical protein